METFLQWGLTNLKIKNVAEFDWLNSSDTEWYGNISKAVSDKFENVNVEELDLLNSLGVFLAAIYLSLGFSSMIFL